MRSLVVQLNESLVLRVGRVTDQKSLAHREATSATDLYELGCAYFVAQQRDEGPVTRPARQTTQAPR